MKCFLFVCLLLLTKVGMTQNFVIKFDTLNFAYSKGPFIEELTELFNETPLSNYIGMDKTKSFPIIKKGLHFEHTLFIKQPTIIQLVNAIILAIPGQEINGEIENNGEFIKIKDSTNINYFFSELRKKATSLRVKLFNDTSKSNLLFIYDSLKKVFASELKYVSLPESRKLYKINFQVISLLKHYCIAELGNLLLSPTYIKKDYSLDVYKKYKNDLNIYEPRILMEFQQGRLFLQRHFFYNALPENNYDLLKTFEEDSFFRDVKIKKYLGFRYFARFYSDQAILGKIKNFDNAFHLFENSYNFSNDQLLALKKLEFQIRENKATILSSILKENLINPNATIISKNEKLQIFGGNIILYIWASWCLPCREYLKELKTNSFTYLGKPYTMIFISIDSKLEQWEKAQYSLFNKSNSFKIKEPTQSDFLKIYELDKAVPRVLLLEDGKLIDPNIDKHLILQK